MVLNFIKASPSQNTTVFITSKCSPYLYGEIARTVMSYEYMNAEQVGFILQPENKGPVIRLEMAGGEFCGNASLAAAAYAVYKGIIDKESFYIEASGAWHPLECRVKTVSPFMYYAECEMPNPVSFEKHSINIEGLDITGSLVDFDGISHFVFGSWQEDKSKMDTILDAVLSSIEAKAVGIIPYRKLEEDNYEIMPYVWVKETGSRVFERGCGSGSMALGIHLKDHVEGRLNVVQPGGEISVRMHQKNYISTRVKFTCEGCLNI
jgi:diaminopimelate epimerase